MRTHDELERLAVAGRPLLAEADRGVGEEEEDRILARILASDRPAPRATGRRRATLVLAGLAVLVAATVAVGALDFGHSHPAAPQASGRHHLALSGAKIKLADYRFKTPAGFRASDSACAPPSSAGQPTAVLNRFGAAASADGGCVEGFLFVSSTGPPTPVQEGAAPVTVGTYQGYFVPEDSSGRSALYVQLPSAADGSTQYLLLSAQGLTEDQLIAVAASGLPAQSASSSNRVVRTLPVDEGSH